MNGAGAKSPGWKARSLVVLAFSLLLSACLDGVSRDPEAAVVFFRDTKVRMTPVQALDQARMSGFWHIRAAFAYPDEQLFRGGVDFQTGTGGEIVQLVVHGVTRGGGFGVTDLYPVTSPAPGRFVFGDPPFATDYWVLWVDSGYQTAVIGTPSGSFGWIIDRSRTGGTDRIAQARKVLRAAGYDMARLEEMP